MKNKRGLIGITIATVVGLGIVAIIILMLALGVGLLISWVTSNILLIIGILILVFGLILSLKTKKPLITILVVVLISGMIIGLHFSGLIEETGLFGTEWEKSVIECSVVKDCSGFLLNQDVSQEDINTIDFKCENKLCWYKQK